VNQGELQIEAIGETSGTVFRGRSVKSSGRRISSII
jgi:hypothetical protein